MTTYRWLDPALGRWGGVDPKAEGAYGHSPYNSMFNNPISMSDPDGDFAFVPILIGAAIGAGIGGAQNGWDGAWNGAITGAIGGTVGQFGGGSFLGNVAWGAGEGALTGGVGSALSGGSFIDGALNGAKWGAVSAGTHSGIEASGNAINGHGFRLNEGVINNYLKKGEFQKAINFVSNKYGLTAPNAEDGGQGPNYSYDGSVESVYGSTNLGSGDVKIGRKSVMNADELKATMAHEFAHYNIDRQYDGIFWDWGPSMKKAKWNHYDGPTGYSAEILNSGRMHISIKTLRATKHVPGFKWSYGSKSITNYAPVNPVWHAKGVIKNKWLYTLPRRF